MALSISVSVGPLANVGINILSWKTAYHLAVNAYGWYKAKERSSSLIEVFSAGGGSLVPSTSFLRDLYVQCRQSGQVQGVVIQNGQVQQTPLPKASTAIPEHPGLLCLRALTAAILCFYDEQETTGLLAVLIPHTLIQTDQEDSNFEIEGPLLSNLQQYVKAVGREEDCDTLRTYILERLHEHQLHLFGSDMSEVLRCDYSHPSGKRYKDQNHVLGVLQWILLAPFKRPSRNYPTRSLRAWNIAAVMMFLGFDVSAHTEIVSSQDAYDSICLAEPLSGPHCAVILVTSSIGATDQMLSFSVDPADSLFLRPRIMALRNTPYEAFRHFRGNRTRVTAEHLADIWMDAYRHGRESVLSIDVWEATVHIQLKAEDRFTTEFQKSLIRHFSPHLSNVCSGPMRDWIPLDATPAWNGDTLADELQRLQHNQPSDQSDETAISDQTLQVIALVMGVIYGIVSTCCVTGGVAMDLEADIVFHPDFLYQPYLLRGWAASIGIAIAGNFLHRDWCRLLLDIVLCLDTAPGGKAAQVYQIGESQYKSTKRWDQGSFSMIMGAQGNGMVGVLQMLVAPSITSREAVILHIGRGQLLSLPLSEEGLILSCDRVEPVTSTLELELAHLMTRKFPTDLPIPKPDVSTRVDVEPAWDVDPRKLNFCIRRSGWIAGFSNIFMVMSCLDQHKVPCRCSEPALQLKDIIPEEWIYVTAEEIMEESRRRVHFRYNASERRDKKYLIDARGSKELTLFCIGALVVSNIAITDNCLTCACRKVSKRPGHAIIILSAQVE